MSLPDHKGTQKALSVFVGKLYSFCLSTYYVYCTSASSLNRESTDTLNESDAAAGWELDGRW